MRFVNPPAVLEKKDAEGKNVPNVVKITNRVLNPDSEEGTKFEVAAEVFVYPQVDSREEIDQICGGSERVLDVFNGFLRDDALKAAKDKIRLASSGSEADIINAAVEVGRNFTYVETAKITASEAKEVLSDLRNAALSGQIDEAELGRRLKAALGL